MDDIKEMNNDPLDRHTQKNWQSCKKWQRHDDEKRSKITKGTHEKQNGVPQGDVVNTIAQETS